VSASAQLTDTHAHLTHPDYRRGDDLVAHAAAAGVARIITVGFDLATSESGARLAAAHPSLWHSPGVHPHDASRVNPQALDRLRRLAEAPRVAAIGETGLDFYHDRSPRPIQVEAFRAHLRLATELGLPVIVHSRQANEEVLAVWKESECRLGVLHCFSGDAGIAQRAVELGLFIGLAGPVTFRNAENLRAMVRSAPRDRIVLETDCPYLAPEPHRGQTNESAYLPLIAQAVARCWGTTLEEVAAITGANATRCFPALTG
jgi:TatD DNase family protein